jgi:hypothetical protein
LLQFNTLQTFPTFPGSGYWHPRNGKHAESMDHCYLFYINGAPSQESPHEHQQNLLLSRIITNVVR